MPLEMRGAFGVMIMPSPGSVRAKMETAFGWRGCWGHIKGCFWRFRGSWGCFVGVGRWGRFKGCWWRLESGLGAFGGGGPLRGIWCVL